MEGICDMFIEEQKEWKQKLIELQIGMNKLQLYEMDHGEEGVLIGEAVWHGGKVLSKWINKNVEVFKG
jgi:hypothetical protein